MIFQFKNISVLILENLSVFFTYDFFIQISVDSHRCVSCEENNQKVECHRYTIDESISRTNHYRNKCKIEEEECDENPELDITIWKYLVPLDDAVKKILKKIKFY